MLDMFVKKMLYLIGAWVFFAVVSYAQGIDTVSYHRLSGVEVVEKARPSVTREATPVQLMDRAGIERLGVQDLSEAVKRFSGVTVQDYGGIGGLKTVSVRSLGAKHTAVSYDGVTVTDAQSGQVDISRFSLDNVEMVSLSIGQADDIFQTARMYASAGALSIKTTKPVFSLSPLHLRAQVKAGSFGMVNPSLRYEQKLGNRWAASLYGDWQRADGNYPFTLVNGKLEEKKKRYNSDIETWRTELNVYGGFGKGGSLRLKGYYFDSERGLPGSVILYNDYAGERLWDKNGFAQAHYENRFNERFALQAQLKYNYAWTRHLDVDNKYEGGKQDDRYTQNEYYGSASALYTPLKYVSFSLTQDFFVNTLDNTLPECPFPTRYTSLTVLAGQYKNSRFTATASLLGTFITEKVKSGDMPADRKRLSPAVSASWRILADQNLRVRASYKDIFRVPTFNDMYYLRIGNTGLKPERATQYNLGLTWSGQPASYVRYLSVSADGYYNRVRDKIVALPTMFIWKMMNMGEVSITGIDVNVSTEIPVCNKIDVVLQGTYTWQRAIDITDEEAKNYRDQIPYTPKHSGTLSLSVENPWVNFSYSLTAVGDRYALPQNISDNLIKGYVEQGISVNREFKFYKCKLRLQGEIINLGNINYDVIQYYPMPGRSYRATVSFIM
ncbi:TonB-dependent receptor [Parabacteroides chinchillae]|uniref:Outer membrane cobalamin receptor protein n=1 Tax=Parabacteroides chinchillae TaxID=871327 RepID=A0A8G2F408_9BACT|nr:TonB-dependent receptor [Parabacteroides chinchillae]SEG26622.1 Outer membrane cobalamin receptor protein [Parabacteroides chinchillae]